MSMAVHASIGDALYALPEPSGRTSSVSTLLRLRTCAALGTALARTRHEPGATDADMARVVYAVYFHVTNTLMSDARALQEAESYWRRIQKEPLRAGLLWLQTLPARITTRPPHTQGWGVRGLRADAEAKCSRLRRARAATVRALGMLVMAWYASETQPVSERTSYLCRVGCDAMSYDEHVDAKASLDVAAAALLDAVAMHESGVSRVLQACGVPGLWTHAWPLVIVYPLISWAAATLVYRHGADIFAQITTAWDAVQGLVVGWIYVPAMRLLDTLRAGRKERALLVRRDSLVADEQSLERMVEALGRDTLHMNASQLAALAERTRTGDLTQVWQVYESAMRAPLRGFLSGSLLRTLLIQVQKAKVDLEVALSGIDWLLKSQELLLGAVGLAPALALVYLLYAGLRRSVRWVSGRKLSLHASGIVQARFEAWQALRHADKLCADDADDASKLGYLLLDASTLRTALHILIRHACMGHHTMRTRLLDEVEADISALECGHLSRDGWSGRAHLLTRMWHSWGQLIRVP